MELFPLPDRHLPSVRRAPSILGTYIYTITELCLGGPHTDHSKFPIQVDSICIL